MRTPLELARLARLSGVGQLADDALALDRIAFREWWHVVEAHVHAKGTAERLWHRAYVAGMAAGQAQRRASADRFDPGPAGRDGVVMPSTVEHAS